MPKKKQKKMMHKMPNGMMMSDKEMAKMHAKKQSFWSKATGGRMY